MIAAAEGRTMNVLGHTVIAWEKKLLQTIATLPASAARRVVVNTSLGYGGPASGLDPLAVDWIQGIRRLGFENTLVHATAAGNDTQ